eukprot:scaffold267903_cov36-Prasinocladus_malaysianus.AAC.1
MMFLDCKEQLGNVYRAGGEYVSEADIPDWRLAIANLELSFDQLSKSLQVLRPARIPPSSACARTVFALQAVD